MSITRGKKPENCKNDEILRSLKYVRPGTPCLLVYLKEKLPYPCDDAMALMTNPKFVIWSPVRRNDVSWNFEKFLVGPDEEPYKRFSKNVLTIDIEADIKELLKRVK